MNFILKINFPSNRPKFEKIVISGRKRMNFNKKMADFCLISVHNFEKIAKVRKESFCKEFEIHP